LVEAQGVGGSIPSLCTKIFRRQKLIISKEELRATVYWAANQYNPIDRDLQILLMTTAKKRHQKFKQSLLLALATKE